MEKTEKCAQPLVVCVGEILWDIFPNERKLGGAPANVAWHAAQMGADSHIISSVGDDPLGREIISRLTEMRLDRNCVYTIPGMQTGTVDVLLDDEGAALYTIHENVAWDRIPIRQNAVALMGKADAVNFGSLVQRTDAGKNTVHQLLEHISPGCLTVFDVNLRSPHTILATLKEGLSKCNVVKINEEECCCLAKEFGVQTDNWCSVIFAQYPSINHIIITRGADGVRWSTRDEHWDAAGKPVDIADTIGAGDSFTATAIMGLLRGDPVPRILENALAVASYVCSQRGATPKLPKTFMTIGFKQHVKH